MYSAINEREVFRPKVKVVCKNGQRFILDSTLLGCAGLPNRSRNDTARKLHFGKALGKAGYYPTTSKAESILNLYILFYDILHSNTFILLHLV